MFSGMFNSFLHGLTVIFITLLQIVELDDEGNNMDQGKSEGKHDII